MKRKKNIGLFSEDSLEKELFGEDTTNTTDAVIKKYTVSDKKIEHNLPSSLIEMTKEDKRRLKNTIIMMNLEEYQLWCDKPTYNHELISELSIKMLC